MTITLELSEEQEERVRRLAAQAGVEPDQYMIGLLESNQPAIAIPKPQNDWERSIIETPKGFPVLHHHLSNEDLSRENVYE